MDGWISCKERLPEETAAGCGTSSKNVKVLLDNGKESEDFLINGRWVWHCPLDKLSGYPIAWKEESKA